MAARLNKRHQDSTRIKIKTSQLINRLQNHVDGEVELVSCHVIYLVGVVYIGNTFMLRSTSYCNLRLLYQKVDRFSIGFPDRGGDQVYLMRQDGYCIPLRSPRW